MIQWWDCLYCSVGTDNGRHRSTNVLIYNDRCTMPMNTNIMPGSHKFSLQASIVHHGLQPCVFRPFVVKIFYCLDDRLTEYEIIGAQNSSTALRVLVHWGGLTHICVSIIRHCWFRYWLLPAQCQAIICTNADLLSLWSLGKNYNEKWNRHNNFLSRESAWN